MLPNFPRSLLSGRPLRAGPVGSPMSRAPLLVKDVDGRNKSGHDALSTQSEVGQTLARRLLRFTCVPPPHQRERGAAVFRHLVGMAETVPARGAHLAVSPLRHDVVVPQ